MTRNTWVSAFICGSHICRVQPSEFDSISVGPPSRPSTETLSRQPSASIMGMGRSSSRRSLRPMTRLADSAQACAIPDRSRPSTRNHAFAMANLWGAPCSGGVFPLRLPCSTWGKVLPIQEVPMAMTMTGEVQLPAQRQAVWDKLNDPDVLKACIPGCEELEETAEHGFRPTAHRH